MAIRLNRQDGKLCYLYGISRGKVSSLVPKLTGVDGESAVEALGANGFTCWISHVSANEFGVELERNMENLDWLAGVSVRHQRVVGAVHERGQILPARFATMFSSEAALLSDVKRRNKELENAFERLKDADEWAVRVFSVPAQKPNMTTAISGRDYLQKKSAMLQTKTRRALDEDVKSFISELTTLAREVSQGGKFGSSQPNLEWYGSLLIPRSNRKKLESAIARFSKKSHESHRIECTGPWPPYSFMTTATVTQATGG